jgi:hypothetical protein
MESGEVIQQLFPSEPATYGLGSATGEPYWNVLELMEIVGETNRTRETVSRFLVRFEALAPRSVGESAFKHDILVYERRIKRMSEGRKVTDLQLEGIDHMKEEDLPFIFINRSWAERIRKAKAQNGVSAMEIEDSKLGPFRLRSPFQAKVRCADGTFFLM